MAGPKIILIVSYLTLHFIFLSVIEQIQQGRDHHHHDPHRKEHYSLDVLHHVLLLAVCVLILDHLECHQHHLHCSENHEEKTKDEEGEGLVIHEQS